MENTIILPKSNVSIRKICPFMGNISAVSVSNGISTLQTSGVSCLEEKCNFWLDDKCIILESLIARKTCEKLSAYK